MERINAKAILLSWCCLFAIHQLTAQKSIHLEKILGARQTDWALTSNDLADVVLKDQYASLHNGLQHAYYTQRYVGIEVYNAVMGIHIGPEGRLQYATSRFVSGLSEKINATVPVLSAEEAVLAAVIHLALDPKYDLVRKPSNGDKVEIFEAADLTKEPVEVRLVYQPVGETVHLAWEIRLAPIGKSDHWNMRVDALTGDILAQDNWVLHCHFPETSLVGPLPRTPNPTPLELTPPPQPKLLTEQAQYHVFPLPIESPLHGPRTIISDPADPMASPFGWHDTDGEAGPEYLITRGNNTHAYPDRGDDNRSQLDEPTGGENLVFDFLFDDRDSVIKNLSAATTQLFYTTNMVHDFVYHYGFDEAAGNFQQTNYNDVGKGNDAVRAHAQNGAEVNSPFQRNNADFSITADGTPPTMQMYIWERSGGNFLQVESPESVAGFYQTGTAEFGPELTEVGLQGQLALAFDDGDRPAKVCTGVVNTSEVKGRIAVIDRGDCFFQQKVLNAEAAGAIACVICNYEDAPIQMASSASLPDPGIPSVVLAFNDCQRIRRLIEKGVQVNLQIPKDSGPEQLDSDFDNGIIVHEYAHGISTRLTGGASTPGCLSNDENLGEGWSDFFALVMTHPTQLSSQAARGIGNYVIPLDINGRGIRRFPYSTSTTVNAQSYDDIIGTSAPHDVGEIWAATLWDMYWAFVETHGWDDDIYTGTGGNNIAVQLVMDGMKLQDCSPGFLDARNAILEADRINNEGANQCLIWEVFARRGLGWSAQQNSANSRNDGLQAFDVRPTCLEELKIVKRVTPNVLPGDDILVELTITNHKPETVTDILISDLLTGGLRLVNGSLNGAPEYRLTENTLQIQMESLPPDTSLVVSYQLMTDPGNNSWRFFLDDVEDRSNTNWTASALAGNTGWESSNSESNSGSKSWYVEGTSAGNDQVLELTEPLFVEGEQPVLRFFHSYLIEPGQDGGFVQVSTDGGQRWYDLGAELFFRNPYRGPLDASTLTEPGIYAFWGTSDDFVDSYLDLSDYLGQEILIRFRYSSDQESSGGLLSNAGWWVDDIEFFDMYNYQTEACISSAQGDRACSLAPGRGAIVEPTARTTDVTTLEDMPNSSMRLYPNPAKEGVTIGLRNLPPGEAMLSVRTVDGRQLDRRVVSIVGNEQRLFLPTAQWSRGIYFVHLQTQQGALVTKLILQ